MAQAFLILELDDSFVEFFWSRLVADVSPFFIARDYLRTGWGHRGEVWKRAFVRPVDVLSEPDSSETYALYSPDSVRAFKAMQRVGFGYSSSPAFVMPPQITIEGAAALVHDLLQQWSWLGAKLDEGKLFARELVRPSLPVDWVYWIGLSAFHSRSILLTSNEQRVDSDELREALGPRSRMLDLVEQ